MLTRCLSFIAALALVLSASLSRADTPLTKDEAAERVRAEGYPLVAKLEQVSGAWNVWASRNGITYQVRIDAYDGSLIAATPVEAND